MGMGGGDIEDKRKVFISTPTYNFPMTNVFHTVSSGGGFFESQEVCLMNDKTDFQQEKTTSKDADQGRFIF